MIIAPTVPVTIPRICICTPSVEIRKMSKYSEGAYMIAIEHCKQIDLNLHQHEVLNLPHPHSGVEIECEQGIVWITSAGDINDHTLAAGESYVVQDSNFLVIEAVQDAVVNLKDTNEEFAVHVAV